jgi:thioredoxin reductase (NADPH)
MDKVHRQMIELGAEMRYEDVLSVGKDGDGFKIKTDENEYSAKIVILAVGTEPRKLSKEQEESAGGRPISYCATCDGALYKGKPVAVVGSGNTARHEMKYLEGIVSEIIHIHHDEPIPEKAEAVFVAIGRIPATDKFKGLVDLDDEGFIIADEDCETSCQGIFAIGDCRAKNVRQLVTAASDGAVVAKAIAELLGK